MVFQKLLYFRKDRGFFAESSEQQLERMERCIENVAGLPRKLKKIAKSDY